MVPNRVSPAYFDLTSSVVFAQDVTPIPTLTLHPFVFALFRSSLRAPLSACSGIDHGYHDTARGFGANKRTRLGENFDPVEDTSGWLKAFDKKPNAAASKKTEDATTPTQQPGPAHRQSDVVMSKANAPISTTIENLPDSPASAPAQQPVDTGLFDLAASAPAPSEDVIEDFVVCLEPQGQTSIEPANITATEDPHVLGVQLDNAKSNDG